MLLSGIALLLDRAPTIDEILHPVREVVKTLELLSIAGSRRSCRMKTCELTDPHRLRARRPAQRRAEPAREAGSVTSRPVGDTATASRLPRP